MAGLKHKKGGMGRYGCNHHKRPPYRKQAELTSRCRRQPHQYGQPYRQQHDAHQEQRKIAPRRVGRKRGFRRGGGGRFYGFGRGAAGSAGGRAMGLAFAFWVHAPTGFLFRQGDLELAAQRLLKVVDVIEIFAAVTVRLFH